MFPVHHLEPVVTAGFVISGIVEYIMVGIGRVDVHPLLLLAAITIEFRMLFVAVVAQLIERDTRQAIEHWADNIAVLALLKNKAMNALGE